MSPPGTKQRPGLVTQDVVEAQTAAATQIVTPHPDDACEFRYWRAFYTGRLPLARFDRAWWREQCIVVHSVATR